MRRAIPPAVAAEKLPVRKASGLGNRLHPPGDLRLRQPEHFLIAGRACRPDGVQHPHGGGGDGDHGALGFGVGLGAHHGDAAAAVVPALHVAPGERRSLGAAEFGVGQYRHQDQVEFGPFRSLLGRRDAAAAPTGLDGGGPDDGEDVGGEGAGLALGPASCCPRPFKEARTPWSRPGDSWPANSWTLAMALVARRMVAMLAP